MRQAASSQRILVVEDDPAYARALKSVLCKAGYETEATPSGQSAISLLALNRFDAVLSDMEMPGGTGLQLIAAMKKAALSVPVIIMTGFTDRNPEHEAMNHGAAGYLAKPFTSDRLLSLFRRVIGLVTEPAKAPVLPEFIEIAADEFVSGRRVDLDLYVRVGSEGCVKIVRAGDELSMERLESFRSRNVRSFFVSRSDFERYIGLQLKLLKGMEKVPVDMEKRLGIIRHANETVLKRLFASGVDRNSFTYAQTVIDANLSAVSRSEEVFSMLEALNRSGEHLLAHSVGVSVTSVMLARKLGWRCLETLRKVSLGGLLHDIGLKDLPKALLDKPRRAYSFEEIKIFEKHPLSGVEMLRCTRSIPTEVLQIVLQHHENRTGTGYPAGLRDRTIFPMARVVALADELCDACLPAPGVTPMEPREAAAYLIEVKRAFIDEALLEALAEIFNLPVRKAEGGRGNAKRAS